MQTEFDFTGRAERERWITKLRFDRRTQGGRPVSRKLLLAVLRRIAHHCTTIRRPIGTATDPAPSECFESQDNIATFIGVKPRTIQAAIRVLRELDLITTERKWRGQSLLNHHRVNWGEVQRSIAGQTATENNPDQPDNLDGVTRQFAPSDPTIGTDQPDNLRAVSYIREQRKKTTTTEPTVGTTGVEPNETTDSVVVVVSSCGVVNAEKAVGLARARGLEDGKILELVRHWRELPASAPVPGVPGVLYNWLTKAGSFAGPRVQANVQVHVRQRGDALSRDQVAAVCEEYRQRMHGKH